MKVRLNRKKRNAGILRLTICLEADVSLAGLCVGARYQSPPSVVLGALLVATSAPVVEGEATLHETISAGLSQGHLGSSYTPDSGAHGDEVDAAIREPGETRPASQMENVEIGQKAPHAVDLGIVAIDLGGDKEDSAKQQGRCKGGYERVGLDIELRQAIEAADGGQPRR